MTESTKNAQSIDEESRQPFVSQEDRPEVRLNLDTPLKDLRVRDLRDILDLSRPVHKLSNTLLEHLIQDTVRFKSLFIKEKSEISDLPSIDREWPPRFHPDPRLDLIIQAVAGLTNQVNQLGNQLEELQKRSQR